MQESTDCLWGECFCESKRQSSANIIPAVCISSSEKKSKDEKTYPQTRLPLRCASQGHCALCSGQSGAGTVHDIHNPGSAGLTSGGIYSGPVPPPGPLLLLGLHSGLPPRQCKGFAAMPLPPPATLRHTLFICSADWMHNLLA